MPEAVSELARTSLLIVGALFPIVNSPENVPIFLALTTGLSTWSRAVLARKIALNGFSLLVVSVLIGTHILAFFGISLPVVQVGGGFVIIAAGWKLLTRPDDEEKEAPGVLSKQPNVAYLTRRAFYPLTMPLTVGPGAISVAIAVGASRTSMTAAPWILPAAAVLGCAFIAITIYLLYRFAEPIGRVVGETAMNVIVRLSSFILLCIGVQILWNGVSALVATTFVSRH